jgi:hypothetical protein
MIFCIEWDVGSRSDCEQLQIDTLDNVAEKNRCSLENGKLPTNFIIGYALTIDKAREFAAQYRALHSL